MLCSSRRSWVAAALILPVASARSTRHALYPKNAHRPLGQPADNVWPFPHRGEGARRPSTRAGRPAPRAGWVSMLLMQRLPNAVEPPGSRTNLEQRRDRRAQDCGRPKHWCKTASKGRAFAY